MENADWVLAAERKVEAAMRELVAEREAMQQVRHLNGIYEEQLQARLHAIEKRTGIDSQVVRETVKEKAAERQVPPAAAEAWEDSEANAEAALDAAWKAVVRSLIHEVALETWEDSNREARRAAAAAEHAALACFDVRTDECISRLPCLAQQMPAALARGSMDTLLRMRTLQGQKESDSKPVDNTDTAWMRRVRHGEMDQVDSPWHCSTHHMP